MCGIGHDYRLKSTLTAPRQGLLGLLTLVKAQLPAAGACFGMDTKAQNSCLGKESKAIRNALYRVAIYFIFNGLFSK